MMRPRRARDTRNASERTAKAFCHGGRQQCRGRCIAPDKHGKSQRDYGVYRVRSFQWRALSWGSRDCQCPGTARNLQWEEHEDDLRLCVLGRELVASSTKRCVPLRLSQSKNSIFEADKRQQMVKELDALQNRPNHGQRIHDCSRWPPEVCPYIVAFHDAFINPDEGNVSIVVEYIDGGSPGSLWTRGMRRSVLATILPSPARLAFVHEKHQVHRDVKPSNLLINHSGAVKVSDFGIVKEWKMPPWQTHVSGLSAT